jgi:hypothetical protein
VADRIPEPVALGDGRVRLVWAGTAVEREAAEIRRHASEQIEAIRQAAEREAAALRAVVMEMSAGPGAVVITTPATKPAVRPVPQTKGRQLRAMRKVQVAFVALALVGVISGAAEIDLHGLSFFLFRNDGAGAGNSRGLKENQGPGQPDAPRTHHAPRVQEVP